MEILRITESGANLRFSPLYVAAGLGLFRDAGLDVRFGVDAGPGGSWLPENLANGKAEIAVGGIWLPLLYRQRGIAPLMTIGTIAHRNGALLLGRAPQSGPFDVADFVGRRVMMSLNATSQWMYWEGVLRERGVEPAQLRIVRDLDILTTTSLWNHGYADYYLVEPVQAETLVARGAYIVATMAELGGPVPWSVFYADSSLIARRPEAMRGFVAAVGEALRRLIAADPEADRVIGERFPNIAPQVRRSVLARFVADGVWLGTTRLDPIATKRYEDIMVAYGLLDPYPAGGPRPSALDIATCARMAPC